MKKNREEVSGDGALFIVILAAVVIVVILSGGIAIDGFTTPYDNDIFDSITPQ